MKAESKMRTRDMVGAITSAPITHMEKLAEFVAMHINHAAADLIDPNANFIRQCIQEWADMQYRNPVTVDERCRKFLVS